MEMPEGLRRFKYHLTPYDLRIQDQYKIVELIKEMAEALETVEQCLENGDAYAGNETGKALKKFKEWK